MAAAVWVTGHVPARQAPAPTIDAPRAGRLARAKVAGAPTVPGRRWRHHHTDHTRAA